MSNTIRRKTKKFEAPSLEELQTTFYWYSYRNVDADNPTFDYDKFVKKHWHKWHSDKDLGWTPPKSFVKEFNRNFRHKAKQKLKCAICDINEDEVVFDPFIKNAGWYYW